MKGIGIDTGGTCTDAVIYDFETGGLTPKNAESQPWLIFLRKFIFCVLRICVYSAIIDIYIYILGRNTNAHNERQVKRPHFSRDQGYTSEWYPKHRDYGKSRKSIGDL